MIQQSEVYAPVADPGFPRWGANHGGGAPVLTWPGGGRYFGPGQGRYPPPPPRRQPDGQTRVKTLTSRRTTYAGGN